MAGKLDYRWNLRGLMASHGMFQTTQLRPKLAERGIELSDSQVYRLVVEKPERLSLKTLVALLDIFGCGMEELIEPIAVAAPRRKAASQSHGADGGVGEFRPKRARIVRDQR